MPTISNTTTQTITIMNVGEENAPIISGENDSQVIAISNNTTENAPEVAPINETQNITLRSLFYQGPIGPPGTEWFNGLGIPDPALGKDLDYYLDDISGEFYKKISGIWEPRGTLASQSHTITQVEGLEDILASLDERIERNETHVFPQLAPSATWIINHNLNKFPTVFITDSAGTVVQGDMLHSTLNTVVIEFTSAFSGTAYVS